MGRLKDFLFGKESDEPQAPESINTNTDNEDGQAGLGEQAFAVPCTNRHPWGDFSLLQSLTPERLAAVLNDVKRGECPADYQELTRDIELKDSRCRSVLPARKDAVTGLEIKVVPASEDKRDAEIANAVERDIVKNTAAKLHALIRDMPGAPAKGFSVFGIIRDTDKTPWKPAACKFRDPRWSRYDKETGKTLMLRAPLGNDLEPLKPFRFAVHEPHLISGNQITAGLAFPALYYRVPCGG
jgi:phage gp29-like protein